jgi:hypothetical protein
MPRTRIGFLSSDVLDFGGVETHLLSIFQLLDHSQFECVLIAPASKAFSRRVEAVGANYVNWQPQNATNLGIIHFLYETLLVQGVSLLHIHSPGVSIAGRIAAKMAKIPTLLSVHLEPVSKRSG